jgi:ferric-dicitrate binding protein FerR (iron transport regulator)
VTLLDGSRATVGADTKLVIAPDFGTTVRAVKLEGTALFAVAPGGKHEFNVRTGDDVSVTATGTTFGVYAYPSDDRIVVGVREGSVTVKSDKETREVGAAKGVVVAKDGAMRDASAGDLDEAMAWTDHKLVVANRPLREAIKQMNRWYALDLRVADSSLLARPVTVNASLESSRDAIAGLEKTGKLAFGYDADKKMVLSDVGMGGDVVKPATPKGTGRRR